MIKINGYISPACGNTQINITLNLETLINLVTTQRQLFLPSVALLYECGGEGEGDDRRPPSGGGRPSGLRGLEISLDCRRRRLRQPQGRRFGLGTEGTRRLQHPRRERLPPGPDYGKCT
jgi:hypothetical protein